MALNPAQLAQYQAMLAAQQPPAPHLQFKAGVCSQSGRTVTADKRRGTVRLLSTDGLLHLQWLTRPGDVMELDLMLLRDSAVWEKVNDCSDGRVFLLRFRDSSSSSTFFWMQEPAADKDADIAQKINKLIASPPDDAAGAGQAAAGAAVSSSAGSGRHPALI